METKEKQDEQMTDSQLREKVNRLWEELKSIHSVINEYKSLHNRVTFLENRIEALLNQKYGFNFWDTFFPCLTGSAIGITLISLLKKILEQ